MGTWKATQDEAKETEKLEKREKKEEAGAAAGEEEEESTLRPGRRFLDYFFSCHEFVRNCKMSVCVRVSIVFQRLQERKVCDLGGSAGGLEQY